jgi:hypothetical protein
MHITNHPLPLGSRGGWCAGAATAVRLLRLAHAGCLPPLQITRSINDYQIDLAMILCSMPVTCAIDMNRAPDRAARARSINRF